MRVAQYMSLLLAAWVGEGVLTGLGRSQDTSILSSEEVAFLAYAPKSSLQWVGFLFCLCNGMGAKIDYRKPYANFAGEINQQKNRCS